jgi:hypothetical protein
MKPIFLFLGIALWISCKTKPGLDQAEIQTISQQADHMDLLFYKMDISVSQTDKQSILQTMGFFGAEANSSNVSCPSIGRISFQEQGKIILEADVHYQGNDCYYFTIIENKKPAGTNLMSETGRKFFSQLLQSYLPKK